MHVLRGTTFRIANKNPRKFDKNKMPMRERFGVDGEQLMFSDFVKFITLSQDLEVIVDYNKLMELQKWFI